MRDTLEISVYESFVVLNDTPKYKKPVLSTEFFGVDMLLPNLLEAHMGVNRFGREPNEIKSVIKVKPVVA